MDSFFDQKIVVGPIIAVSPKTPIFLRLPLCTFLGEIERKSCWINIKL